MPNALASLPSGRERSVSFATPAIESRMLSRKAIRRSRCIFRKGVIFTGPFASGFGLWPNCSPSCGFVTGFVLPFAGALTAGLVALGAFASGFFLTVGLGAGFRAFAFATGLLALALGLAGGFLAAFFGVDFGMGKWVYWKEKGGIDTDSIPVAQGGNGNFFAAPSNRARREQTRKCPMWVRVTNSRCRTAAAP